MADSKFGASLFAMPPKTCNHDFVSIARNHINVNRMMTHACTSKSSKVKESQPIKSLISQLLRYLKSLT